MESIKLNSGIIRLEIDCDGEKNIIAFNPEDVNFAEGVYRLMADMEEKQAEFKNKEAEIAKAAKFDENGIPDNFGERLALYKDVCDYMRVKIDELFGEGTSQKVFGDANTLNMFEQFFDGIAPYIRKARESKLESYRANIKNVME